MLHRTRIATLALALAALGVGMFARASLSTNQAQVEPKQPLALGSAPQPVVSFKTEPVQDRSTRALALISYDWEEKLPGWRIEFIPGDSAIAGYTWSHEQRIEVFVKDDSTAERLARVLAHELGHAVDVSLNSPEERTQWLIQRGTADTPWWPSSGAADFETGAGDFAESFAAWQFSDVDFRSNVASFPSTADLAMLAAFADG